ncbi:MAG TPA: hypothetical protein EYP10_03475, partial [Armatimonadetes bacterium]|nr:hypothetical protein [Armatimonadota bacterium]
DRDAPNSIIIWKTAIANDLRFRIVHADGKYSEIAVPRTLSVGDWHYITFTWDIERGTMTAYLNGALVGRRRLREAPFDPSAISFCIGAGPTGAESAQAVFDDFKIYARVKQQREVSNSYERFLMTERFTFTDETNAPPLNMSTALLSPPQLLFAVISDTHISAPNVHGRFAHNERVRWLIKQLNAFKPALIVNCGDINTYFPRFPGFEEGMKEAQRLMKQLAVPVYQAPGNHDVGNKHQLTFRATPNRPAEGWFVNEENIAVYRKFFGPDYFSFDKGGCHFIVLNNQVFNSGLPTEREQWQWLLSDLADHRNARFIFMFMHNPLFWVSPDDIGTNNYEVVNEPRRSELMELIRKYRVTAVFTGHTHHRISNLLDNTRYLTLPSTTFTRPFGRNYERSMLATIYDPLKVGYYIVRVYDNAVHINLVRHYAPLPKRINIQADNAQPRIRLLNRVATEVDDNLLGITSALPPPIEYGQWASEHLIDGVTGEMVTGDRISQFGWTSQPYAPNEQHEWVELELARLVSVAKIELYPRPGGGGFPISFTVALSADGKRYERIARFDDFPQPTSAKPVVIEVPAERRKPVKYVRVDITRMPPMYLGHRASFMEIAVRDEHGRNYAIAAAGAKVRTKSQASSTRR